MSLAPPTRPLPTPETAETSSPQIPSNTRPHSSIHSSSSSAKSPGPSGSEGKRRDPDRSDNVPGKDAASKPGGDAGSAGLQQSTAPGIRLHINDVPEGPSQWGANFWVTIEDPMTQAIFYACPSTGEASWEPPVETFLMPLSEEGQWWELVDESRGGLSYYYQTKTGETQWTRPEGFVIPLNIIQETSTLGRRLSLNGFGRQPQSRTSVLSTTSSMDRRSSMGRRSRSYGEADRIAEEAEFDSPTNNIQQQKLRRIVSNEHTTSPPPAKSSRVQNPHILSTIPGSPDVTSGESTPSKRHRDGSALQSSSRSDSPSPRKSSPNPSPNHANGTSQTTPKQKSSTPKSKSKALPSSNPSQSLGGMAQMLQRTLTNPDDGKTAPSRPRVWFPERSPSNKHDKNAPKETASPQSPKRPIPAIPTESTLSTSMFPRQRRNTGASNHTSTTGSTMEIGSPVADPETAAKMNPLRNHSGKPIFVDMNAPQLPTHRFSTGDHHTLPRELVEDIQKFMVADFANRYFSTHRTGMLFRRKVPVEQMMSWQKAPLSSPLLVLNRALHKDAVKAFKVIQRVMGDRDRDRPIGVRMVTEPTSTANLASASTLSLGSQRDPGSVIEEERWMLAEGLEHGELRDEIYCQVIKQLSNNPNPESIFHGWQLLCVLLVTFPPSKNLEAYLRCFIQDALTHREGRIDIMAKYCLQRLTAIAQKGSRGRPPTCQEIENAADAAFNPSTFGESLESIFRLQQRTYPDGKVPIILPFLADSIIALGGTKREGIFRIPGDNDAISDMKVRIDKGHYNLQGIDDPHVPASLLKLWLRELQDPLIPAELYNDCIACAENPEEVVAMVKKLPKINRRVLLFVISFLQLFLPEHVSSVTKMTSPNLALVMAPNLLRCNSESMSVVFANSRFEHIFVHNLLTHLKCSKVDPDYVPVHGLGASASGQSIGRPKASRARAGQ